MVTTLVQSPENASSFCNISGYRFVRLEHLPVLQADLLAALTDIGVLGTVLLADEGINVALAGSDAEIAAVRRLLDTDPRFASLFGGLWLKDSPSAERPFSRLKVRIRHEIIAFEGPGSGERLARRSDAPTISPARLKAWLDEGRNLTLLDTRNHYEIESGTFARATDLGIRHFRDFRDAVTTALTKGELDQDTPMVTFCTGGIRCEKAAPWLIEQGFSEVYQIDGGILNYFADCGDAHWQGDCFVFDDRVEITPALQPTGAKLCKTCHRRIVKAEVCECDDCALAAANGLPTP